MSLVDWEALERAIADHDWVKARRAALESWRGCRHPRLADLVDWLDEKSGAAPLSVRTSFHEAWLAAVREADDLGPLAATLTRSLPVPASAIKWPSPPSVERYASWLARVEALRQREDDPRVARALLEVIATAPWTTSSDDIEALFVPALEVIERVDDRRTAQRMRALLAKPIARQQYMRRILARLLPPVLARLEARPTAELTEEELERLERWLAPVAVAAVPSEEDALFALVVADRASDAPRAVLADHWLERGEPRGEFVTKQLAGQPEEELSRKHDRDWLGELAGATSNRRYERGFLAELELTNQAVTDPAVWSSLVGSRDLGTVEVIHRGRARRDHYRRFLDAARGLRVLTADTKRMALDFAERAEPWPVTRLELGFVVDPKTARALASANTFPELTEVALAAKAGSGSKLWAAAEAFAKRGLSCVSVLPLGARLAESELASLMASTLAPEREIVSGRGGRKIVVRASETTPGALQLAITCDRLRFVEELVSGLRALKVALAEVTVQLPPDVRAPTATVERAALEELRQLGAIFDAGWAKGTA